jgi:hypothetical protein
MDRCGQLARERSEFRRFVMTYQQAACWYWESKHADSCGFRLETHRVDRVMLHRPRDERFVF